MESLHLKNEIRITKVKCKALLPPLNHYNTNVYTLVLDLDETLVHFDPELS
jgi:predicted HAD superfamily phosphohydrolase YqeG